ncbi:OLC1v1015413C1 [Oldenlandia corymbosa var. corymbosa]|nr:OLC1v1015413C1 [Oldenlandia corymbosa var. corymbosa]
MDKSDGDQQPYAFVQSNLNEVGEGTIRDAEGNGLLHGQEEGVHSIERVESSIPDEVTAFPFEQELSAEFWMPPEPEDSVDDTKDSVFNEDDDDDEEFSDGINWGSPSSLSGFEDDRSGIYKFKEEKQRALEDVKNGKFKVLVDQLLKSVGVVSSRKEGEDWVDIVASLSWDAAKFVKPDAADGKAMDPDGYVKIKCIASGSPSHSKFIKGLVFKKHAAHKHMPTKYQKPRLLLIQGALGFSSNGLSSFESMHQEKDSLKSIIDVIEMYQPNIILVEKTVSRDIQETILGKGITLVLDMKFHRLERIARCTGSLIWSSDGLTGQKLRQCNSFHFEKFVEELAVSGETAKKPSKTLMFLEGCPTRLGCTILLVGADSDQLKRIKCVVRCAVIMAYHFMLETCFLLDTRVMFASIGIIEVPKLSNQVPSSADANGETWTESTPSNTLDFANSDGADYLNPSQDANMSFSKNSNPVILSGLLPLSDSLEKVIVSNQAVSTYFAFDEGKSNDGDQGDLQVSISTELVDHCGSEKRGSVDEDNEGDIKPHSKKPLAAQSTSENYDDSKPVKDDIKAVLDSESILVSKSTQNAKKGTMCEQSHFSHIKFYRNFDVPLGKFLHENLLNQSLHCKTCNELPEAHFYYYVHHSKQLKIQVRCLPNDKILPGENDGKLWMWSRCGQCISENGRSKSTKRVLISTDARGLSFGKFLELSFANPYFRRKSSCGHSLHRDYLYFFGLGPMVGMFKYSKFDTYSVSLPPRKLEFRNLISGEHLKKELENVHSEGISMFLEFQKRLQEIGSKYLGMHINLHGLVKEFSEIEKMLMVEKSQFEVEIKNVDGNEDNAMCKYLKLNRIRLDLLLESSIWDKRLNCLLSSDLSVLGSKTFENGVTRETGIDILEKADGTGITAEDSVNALDSHRYKGKLDTFEAENNIEREIPIDEVKLFTSAAESYSEREIPIDGQNESAKEQDGPFYLVTEDVNTSSVETACGNKVISQDSSVSSQYQSVNGSIETSFPSYAASQTDKVVPISSEFESSLLDSKSFQSGRSHYRLSFNERNDKGWIWNSFTEIRQAYMSGLWGGYLPKFDTTTSLAPETAAYKLIAHEGSKLHIPLGEDDYIVSDYEDELSSIISCSLALLKDLPAVNQDLNENPSKDKTVIMSNDSGQNLPRIFSLNSPHWSSSGYPDSDGIHSSASISSEESLSSSFDSLDLLDSVVSMGALHPEVSMGIGKVPGKRKYSVICVYSSRFRQLRNRCCQSEVDYIASLSRCKNWDAKGGKSKSFFAKTIDDRFIIKEIKKTEFEAFMKFAPNYFDYMDNCYEVGNQTCLAKILGVYQVTIRATRNGKEIRHDLMVMENLSFGRNIDRQYDLKGALHARFNSTSNGPGDVLLDQNFLNDINVSPLYVNKKSKQSLQRAVWNDTTFLKSIYVMDYSLLLGVDTQGHELSCGIIDYLRQYTWDKQLETWVKSSLVVPKNQLPTIISPIEYRRRFRKFIGTHFLGVPDHWCSQRSTHPCLLCGVGDYADDEDDEDPLLSKLQKLGSDGADSHHSNPQ